MKSKKMWYHAARISVIFCMWFSIQSWVDADIVKTTLPFVSTYHPDPVEARVNYDIRHIPSTKHRWATDYPRYGG